MSEVTFCKDPIGLFDSGIGGTTIWKEINALLPNESTLFLADNKNAPYGEKTKEEIITLCDANTQFLLAQKAKLIVVACNTGTTNAISYLRNKYKEVPFIGIEPAIKPASLQSITKKIGVLATRSTLASDLFAKTSEHLKQEEKIEINGKYYLKPELEVHHIDENKLNNSLENLQIMTKPEHKKLHTLKTKIKRDNKTGRFIKSTKE